MYWDLLICLRTNLCWRNLSSDRVASWYVTLSFRAKSDRVIPADGITKGITVSIIAPLLMFISVSLLYFVEIARMGLFSV